MHAGDERVGGQDKVLARRRREQRGVIAKPETGGTRERRKIARDEFVFAGAGGHEAERP